MSGGWKAIDSAPRDGSYILVFGNTKREGPRAVVARFVVHADLGEHWETALVISHHPRCGVDHHVHVHPTHWRPLPKPPRERR